MTPPFLPKRVAILGVGLLGGSLALSLRRKLPQTQFVGYSRSEAKRRLAIDLGVIDVAAPSIEEASDHSDVIVVAAPVDKIAEVANLAAAAAPPDCLITDVGSTKATIVDAISLPNFVAAHPIAGSEKTGAQNATAELFDGKLIVITPGPMTDSAKLQACEQFWQLTGGRTVQLSPAEHDAHLAAVSHVPHLMSSLVARLLPDAAGDLVGSGWRDITRVAAGDPTLWTAICSENRLAILEQLKRLTDDVESLTAILRNADDQRLHEWLREAQMLKQATE
ncbi:prephenate dehydrogenase [Planctomycetes bacterium K23_9]|uniref:Prephenate dehydrogenase n=1 Tax=Stieleria marina TaxID=1930275 RepID=A0A517NPY9_9BACT|nr:prephenate dehydrogenase [Planctomycetes bacterium K23_9]